MKPQINIPKLIQYSNNRLSPTDMLEVQQWIQNHPQGETIMRGLETLLQQENRNTDRILALLRSKKTVLSRKLFGKKYFR